MIKGLYDGFDGLVYIYYRGKVQLVLSDVNAGHRGGDVSETALRVVLQPNMWTEVAYKYIRDSFEKGNSQLNYLEKDGYVDIYTDKKEVDAIKNKLANADCVDIKTTVSIDDVLAKQANKYFDLKDLNEVAVAPTEKESSKIDKVLDMVMEQSKQNAKQNEQMMKLMETTQQLIIALVSNKNDTK